MNLEENMDRIDEVSSTEDRTNFFCKLMNDE